MLGSAAEENRCDSRLCLEQLKELYGFDESRVRLNENGVDSVISPRSTGLVTGYKNMEGCESSRRNGRHYFLYRITIPQGPF